MTLWANNFYKIKEVEKRIIISYRTAHANEIISINEDVFLLSRIEVEQSYVNITHSIYALTIMKKKTDIAWNLWAFKCNSEFW